MRALTTELFHLLLSFPFYLVLGLAGLSLRAWRAPAQPARLHRFRYGLLALALLVYAVSIPATANALLARLERQWPVPSLDAVRATARPGELPTVLVLTAGWFRRTEAGWVVVMGAKSWERTAQAVDLHDRLGGANLLFTGAPLPDGSDSVAQHMAEAARRWGVPPPRIGVEPRSVNTHENLLFSERQFGLSARGTVVLLTSAIHMPRSVAAARAAGVDVLPYPCDFYADTAATWRHFLPSNEAPGALEEVLHEWFGLLQYRLRGWA